MCQPKDKGGRRCPMHQPASIGLRRFINAQYGLIPDQVEHTFKGLRTQGENRADPTMAEYEHFIMRQKTILGNSNLDDKVKARIERQFDKTLTESELPDGATFFALKKLLPRSREQKHEFVQMIREIADHKGVSRNKALAEFRERYAVYEGATKTKDYANWFDSRTYAVANQMLDRKAVDPKDQVPSISPEPRIQRADWRHRSTWITSVGYDPEGGRIEIETDSGVHAFHNVPQHVWEQNIKNNMRNAPSYISRNVFRNPEYQYESREAAAADAYGRWCRDCHKYRAASGHICEGPSDERVAQEEEQTSAVASTGALTYEEALERLKAEMRESGDGEGSEQPEESPRDIVDTLTVAPARRRRVALTARQRRWTVPVEEREHTTIELTNENAADPTTGRRTRRSAYLTRRIPAATDIRAAVLTRGEKVTFPYVATRYAYEDTGHTRGNVTYEVTAVAVNQYGDLDVQVSEPKCDCETYQRNGHCVHVDAAIGVYSLNSAENRAQAMESSVAAVNRNMHEIISPESWLRSSDNAAGGNDVSISPRYTERRQIVNRVIPDTMNGSQVRVELGTLSTAEWRRVRNLVSNGTPVEVNLGNFNAQAEGEPPHFSTGARVRIYQDDEGSTQYEFTGSCDTCGLRDCSVVHGAVRTAQYGFEGRQVGDVFRTPYSTTAQFDGSLYDYAAGVNRHISAEEEFSNLSSGQRLEKLDDIAGKAWTSDFAATAEMQSTFAAPSGVDRSYSSNLEQYVADYREAQDKAKNGGSALAYTRENATNGICAPETGRGFGVELELDISGTSGEDKAEKLRNLGRELYEAGLTPSAHQTGYHSNQRSANPYSAWSFENDCTVDAEIVSPVLYDQPSDWEQIEKVCEIVKRNGGKASVRTGGHVHMGLGGGSTAEVERRKVAATQIYAAYQDTLRRVQANPDTKKHRDSQWCQPLSESSAQESVYTLRGGGRRYEDHSTSLNLGHSGRIEFRGADGSLDPAHIQAQVVTAAAVVSAAERGELPQNRYSKVGANARKMAAITAHKKDKSKVSDDELVVSDVELRSFTDTFMNYDHGRKVMVGIAANTPWQETKYNA